MAASDHVNVASRAVRLTYDDLALLPDDGKRHELIGGEHHVTPSPNTRHQTIVRNLMVLFGGWLEQHPLGQLFCAPYDVVLSPFDVVEPDVLYQRAGVLGDRP